MKSFRLMLALLIFVVQTGAPILAADLYWDPDLTVTGNNTVSGVGLGGPGDWGTTLNSWYNGTDNIAWNNAGNDTAIFAGTAGAVTLSAPITVGGLTFRTTGYTLDAGAFGLSFGAASNPIVLEGVAAATISGLIGGSGAVNFSGGRRRGLTASTLTFAGTSAGGWTGATTIGNLQTVSLSGLSQALLSTTGGITLNGGGITIVNTTNAEALLDRVNNSAITSNGGTFTVTNTAAAVTSYAETIGAISLNSGRLNVVSTNALASGTSTLTLGGLTQSGTASIGFGIGGLAAAGTTTAANRIDVTGLSTTAANQIIGPWATVGTTAALQTDYASFNRNAGTVNALGIQGANIAGTAETTWTVAANAYTQSAAQTLTAGRTITALRNTAATATTALAGNNLDTFGLLNGATTVWTISSTTGAIRQQGTAAANVFVNTGAGAITISAPINDNTGALTLVKDGSAGTLTLSSVASTFSGGLVVNAGTVSIASDSNLGNAAGGVTFNGNGTLVMTGTSQSVARNFSMNNGAIATLNTTAAAGNMTTYSGLFSGDGGLNITNTNASTVSLTGENTFTGPVAVTSGILGYTTVSNNGGPASNLGQGTDGIVLSGGTLNFIGSTNQSTDRAILLTAGSSLGSNGTGGASITYAGPIIAGGSNPTFNGTGATVITGGVSQTGNAADWVFAPTGAGTLTVSGTPWSIADDFTLTGAGAASVLSLNSTGVYATNGAANTDARLIIRNGTLSIGANNPIVGDAATGVNRISLADGTTAGTGTLAMNGFALSIPGLDLGATAAGFDGSITGGAGSLLTVGNTLNLNRGTIASDVALAGSAAIVKSGTTTITLSGDNSGLTGTSTRIDAGSLVLDYTTQNNNKLSSASVLDMRGSTLTLNGNAAATTQTVASTTFANGGANSIVVNAGAGGAVLNLNAITRAALSNDSAVRFVLPSGIQSSTNGITTDSANNNTSSGGILGGWATVSDGTGVFFARNATNGPDGNIVAANATTLDSVSSWTSGINVTDSSGFTGTLANCLTINSLRFNANATSTVTIPSGSGLRIASGGVLMTSNVASGSQSISGGTLSSGINELIFTQDSTQGLTVSSRITGATGITKAGIGAVTLSGLNDFSGIIDLQAGTLIASGGTAIGDNSVITLADDQASTFQLVSNESIGGLAGGNATAGQLFGTVDVGANTLTIRGGGGYAGVFTGNGTITRNTSTNATNINLTGVSSGFTGTVNVDGGLLQLSGLGQIDASVINVNRGGNLLLDNNGGTRSATRILDTTPINLNSADGAFATQTAVRGLAIRTDQNAASVETIGSLNFASGANYLNGDASGGTSAAAIIQASNFVRTNNATVNARARGMGATANERTGFRISNATNQTAFIGTLVGGGGAAGTQNISIVPWGIGETLTAVTSDLNMGNSLITYVSGAGFRALDLTTEYNTLAAATATQNARVSLTANAAAIAGKTVNSLVLHNASTTGNTTWSVTGTGAGQTLAVTSGALLFTRNTAAAGNYGLTLGGFNGGITTAGALPEYVIHVVNPDSASTTKTLTATISSPLTSVADITKAGRGILVLSGTNAAGGNTKKTTISEGVLQISSLDNIGGSTGGLVFSGGTLRLGAGFTGDVSSRTVTFLNGGGTIDTNGLDSVIGNSFGTGAGSFTKAGAGNLTLNGVAGYSGSTTVTAGRLILDAGANRLPTGGGLTMSGGTLQLGNAVSADQAVTSLSGASAASAIVGGNATPSVLTVNQDIATTYAGLIGGAGANENNISLVKNGNGNLTLGAVASTFTGGITINSGRLTGGDNANTFGANTNVITLGATSGTADATLSFFNSRTFANPITVAAGSSGTAAIVLGSTTGSPIVEGPIAINKDLLVTKEGTTGVGVISGGVSGTGNLLIRNEATLGTINLTTNAINNVGTIVNKGFATGATTISAPIGTNVTSIIQDSATSALILGTPTNTYAGNITVRKGTLSFANGVGTPFASLSGLSLGVDENTGLELDVADGATDTLTTLTAASVSRVTTLFIKDVDITSGNTYNLLVDPNNGLGSASNYLLNLPGYTGSSLTVTPGLVQLTAGVLVTNNVYWAGGASTTAWNTVVPGPPDTTNFSTDVAGSTLSETLPGKGQKVIFQADNVAGGAPLATTLEQSFTVNALEFRPSGTAANTSRISSIAPGAVTSNTLSIRPTSAADGINLQSGSSGTVNISANIAALSDQTWTVSDAPVELTGTSTTSGSPLVTVSSKAGLTRGMPITGTNIPANTTILAIDDLLNQITLSANASATVTGTGSAFATQQLIVSGSISGTGSITKAGPGRLILGGAGSGYTGAFSASSGITEISVGNALSGIVSNPGSGAPISIGSNATLYVNAAATTLPNNLTINGGTLSAGTGNQTYSGTVNITANSTINMRDNASTTLTAAARNVTLPGVISGAGRITLDSNNALNASNQIAGTLTINGNNSAWSGGLNILRGTVLTSNANGLGTGAINYESGRIQITGLDSEIRAINNNLSVSSPTAISIGEFSIDNNSPTVTSPFTVNLGGTLTLGGAGGAGELRLFLADAANTVANFNGAVTLANNGAIHVRDNAAAVATFSGGIGESGGARSLTINGPVTGNTAWGGTAGVVAIPVASSYTGGTTIAGGTARIGSNLSLGAGAVTVTGASTLQTTSPMIGVNSITNSLTLDASLTVNNANDLTLTGVVAGVGGLTKTGAGTLTLMNSNTYSGATQIDNGTLRLGAANALAATTPVRLGTGATAGTLDLNGFDQTIGALTSQTNDNTLTNNIVIGAANVLTVNGGVTFGVNANNSDTNVSATGGGSIIVNSGGANFQVGGATTLGNESRTDVDFSGLTNFTANLGAGTFRVGDNSATSDGLSALSTIRLATNSTITASSVRVGDGTGPGGDTHVLTLGSGANIVNADTINIGSAGANLRSGGSIAFHGSDTTGTLLLRASDGSGRSTINMINTSGNTAAELISVLDLTGHTADVSASNVTLAARSLGAGATATLSFDQGTLDITTLNFASRTGAGPGIATGTVNLGDSAAPGVPSTLIGTINMGVNTSTAAGTVTADLNITGGNVNIGTGAGTAINLANAATGRTVISTIDLTGGVTTVTGNIVRTGGAGTETATITLDGGTLNLSGNGIGSAAASVGLVAASGTLQNLAQLNGGGSLTKTTVGTLTLGGTNTYTGATQVTSGSLLAGSAQAFGLNSAVTVDATGILRTNGFSNSIGSLSGAGLVENADPSPATLTVGSDNTNTTFTGLIQDGVGGGALSLLKVGTGTLILTNTNTFTGANSVAPGSRQVAGSTQAFGVNSAVSVTGALQLAGFSNSIGSLSGNGTVENANAIASTLTTGGNNTSTTFSGLIQDGIGGGSISVIKSGTGSFELTGANTYSGPTSVNAGMLVVNNTSGSGTGTGVVTVAGGATLGGTGTITGDVNFLSGAIYSPGNSPGIQNLAGNVNFNAGSVFNWELTGNVDAVRGTAFDGVDSTGASLTIATGAISNLVFNGAGSTVSWADSFWDNDRQWLVFDNTNAPTVTPGIFGTVTLSTDSTGQTLTPARGSFAWTSGGNDILLSYTAVAIPEPGTLALLGLVGAASILIRRRRSNRC